MLTKLLQWRARLVLCVVCGFLGPVQAQTPADQDLSRFLSWFGGEWNNNEQVWQQKIDAEDPKITAKVAATEHLHHIFTPVVAPKIGENLFYVQQSRGGELNKVFRQRVYRFSSDPAQGAIRLDIFTLNDEKRFVDAHRKPTLLAELTPPDLKPMPGCEVYWRFDAKEQAFNASMPADRCNFVSTRSGKRIFVNDTLRLTEQELLINDQAHDESGQRVFGNADNIPSRNRKVRYFEGWVWFKLAGPGAAEDDKKTNFTAKYLLHSEGQRMTVLYEDGTPSPYMLELAILTYQNTRKPVLKFTLLDRETHKSKTYVWANAQATTIGMNLGWFQAGVAQKSERPHFGF
jgi:hypothetical protein